MAPMIYQTLDAQMRLVFFINFVDSKSLQENTVCFIFYDLYGLLLERLQTALSEHLQHSGGKPYFR